MHPHHTDEIKVKVATRQETVSPDTALLAGLLLLVIVSVIVLIGRSAGGM